MQILDVHDTDTVEVDAEKHAKNARYKKNKSEVLFQKAAKEVKANKSKPERNINDLAAQLSDELAAKGITYNPDTMWDYINQKWKKQEINNNEFKALKKLLGKQENNMITKNCSKCGKKFHIYDKKYNARKYCNECSKPYRIVKSCRYCGNPFSTHDHRGKYFSKSCGIKARQDKNLEYVLNYYKKYP